MRWPAPTPRSVPPTTPGCRPLLAVVILVPILVAGPELVSTLPFGATVSAVLRVLYWPVVVILGITLVAAFYHVGTPWKTPWLWDLPGAAVAAGLWVLFGFGLRIYAGVFIETDPT